MSNKIRPVDVIRAHPDSLSKIKPVSELDKQLLDSLQWGFALHPDEANNTQQLSLAEGTEIDWSEKDGFDDVKQAVRSLTTTPLFPIAGPAEHVISLRRLTNAQDDVVRNGEAWQYGTTCHLKDVFQNQQ